MNLYNRNFLTLLDFSKEEIDYLLSTASDLKEKKHQGILTPYLVGKNIAMIFEKDSTRTRCSFEVASNDLGMHAVYLGPTGTQIGKKESIKDTARVLGSMFDGIEYRGFGQSVVETLAEYAKVPVWNGLTNEYHPTQVLADLMTIKEVKGTLANLKMVYLGDARYNMGNSLMIGASKMGMNFTALAPKALWPSKDLYEKCLEIAKPFNTKIVLSEDIDREIIDADVIVTDVWVSMGEADSVWEERIKLLLPFQVNKELMAKAKKNPMFLHCLPSFHNLETTIGKKIFDQYHLNGLEVTDDVFESENSYVFQEAENRLHTIKAVLYRTLCDHE